MDKKGYVNKFEEIIKDEIRKGIHETTTDTCLDNLREFQSYLHRNFKE